MEEGVCWGLLWPVDEEDHNSGDLAGVVMGVAMLGQACLVFRLHYSLS